jgi:hypothetical protein
MSYKCLHCGKEFDWRKSLHGHLRKHSTSMEEYYLRFYPRTSLYSRKPIPFTNVDDYLKRDFLDKRELRAWFKSADKTVSRKYLVDMLKDRAEEKGLTYAPSTVDLGTLEGLPTMDICESYAGGYAGICKDAGLTPLFPKRSEKTWMWFDDGTMKIGIDTREKIPFVFLNERRTKLEVGDYTALGLDFSNIFIDRKSPEDFCNTLSMANVERFRKEVQRAKELDACLFVVVESKASDISRNWNVRKYCGSIDFVFHNMRQIEHSFPRTVQFVFCNGRAEAQDVCYSILKKGAECREMDVQYEISKWLGK